MGSEWQLRSLEDCMDAIIDYRGKTPKKTSFGVPLITAKVIKNGAISPTSEFIAEADYEAWMRRGMPKPGDVVVTTEAPLGEVAQLDTRKIALAQRVIALRGKQGFLDNGYLKYLMSSEYVQHQLDGRATGTTVKGIKQSELRKVELRFPPYKEQVAIAHILGTLDNKIEMNRQMNATLEAMAQALFKSWFVDFDPVIDNALAAGNPIPEPLQARAAARQALGDQRKPLPEAVQQQFPSRFVFTEEMGWIPEGWRFGAILDQADLLSGGTPKTDMDEYWDGDIPWASAKDVSQCGDAFLIQTERRITQAGLDKSSTKLIDKLATVIVSRGATTGRLAMFGEVIAMNQTCYALRTKNKTPFFLYCHARNFISTLVSSAHGSVFDTITTSTFRSTDVLLPSVSAAECFDARIRPQFERLLSNLREVATLRLLRDTLLPKLLSGELRIPDAVELVREAS